MTTKEHFAVLDASAALHDKQIKVIRDLVRVGMKLMVETRKDLRETQALSRENQATLKSLLGKPGNGKGLV